MKYAETRTLCIHDNFFDDILSWMLEKFLFPMVLFSLNEYRACFNFARNKLIKS